MSLNTKRVEDLTVEDIGTAPVWQFTNSDGPRGETVVRALKKVPVKNLKGRIVGTSVLLANGSSVWALLGNVVSDNSKLTQHFLTLSVQSVCPFVKETGRGGKAIRKALRRELRAIGKELEGLSQCKTTSIH